MTVLWVGELVSIVLAALVAGVFWGPWVGLTRSIAGFDAVVFLAIGQRLNRNLGPLMRVLMPVTLLSMVPTLVATEDVRPAAFYPTLAGAGLFVLALLVTVLIEVPIASRIRTWTVGTLPADWRAQRDRWAAVHIVRVLAGVLGLACLVAGAITP